MKVLIACEFSGVVREAFREQGHDAWSCDLLPSEIPGQHIQGDVLELLDNRWDMLIAFPPCTYLCRSGLHWNNRIPERNQLTIEALQFVRSLMQAPIPHFAIENPPGCISTSIRKPDQIIQPYQFGEDASKATCLWLKRLPKLKPTCYVEPRMANSKRRWSNQTDSGQDREQRSDHRWMDRSRTYRGIAEAMAQQWTNFKLPPPFPF